MLSLKQYSNKDSRCLGPRIRTDGLRLKDVIECVCLASFSGFMFPTAISIFLTFSRLPTG